MMRSKFIGLLAGALTLLDRWITVREASLLKSLSLRYEVLSQAILLSRARNLKYLLRRLTSPAEFEDLFLQEDVSWPQLDYAFFYTRLAAEIEEPEDLRYGGDEVGLLQDLAALLVQDLKLEIDPSWSAALGKPERTLIDLLGDSGVESEGSS